MPVSIFGRIAAAYALCTDIISAVELLPGRTPAHIRFRLTLTDGSRLHVSEDWQTSVLGSYSYYWLDPTDKLIIGWDNAPHHTDIATFPHHRHVGTQTNREPSAETSLEDVLMFVRNRLFAGPDKS